MPGLRLRVEAKLYPLIPLACLESIQPASSVRKKPRPHLHALIQPLDPEGTSGGFPTRFRDRLEAVKRPPRCRTLPKERASSSQPSFGLPREHITNRVSTVVFRRTRRRSPRFTTPKDRSATTPARASPKGLSGESGCPLCRSLKASTSPRSEIIPEGNLSNRTRRVTSWALTRAECLRGRSEEVLARHSS